MVMVMATTAAAATARTTRQHCSTYCWVRAAVEPLKIQMK
jgi:hypothetical protein